MTRRPLALLLAVVVLAWGGCDADRPAPRGATAPPTPTSPDRPAFDPPSGDRWVGAHRVVVAVPSDWLSIETPICREPPAHSVVFYNPQNFLGCPYMPGPRRSPTYLSIDPHASLERSDRRGTQLVELGGVKAYTWNHPHSKYGQSAGILVPAQHLAMYVHTDRPRLARTIIDSVAAVPRGFRVIPAEAHAPHRLGGMMAQLRHHQLRPTYAEVPPGRHSFYGYPGGFIRTDPPVGTPVARGTQITASFSAGRLSIWISARRLAAQGWSVEPPTSFTPRVDRSAALARLNRAPNERAAFLRTLTIAGRSRQAWLVVNRPRYVAPGQAEWVAAVDARSGRVWRAPTFFPATR